MNNSKTKQSQDKKDYLWSLLVNPEAYFWVALLLFGTGAAGWFLIGVGIFFALIPLVGLVTYALFRKRNTKPNEQT